MTDKGRERQARLIESYLAIEEIMVRNFSLEERAALGGLLARAGVVRVTEAGEMSRTIPGEAHDGDYPLRLYSRVVEIA